MLEIEVAFATIEEQRVITLEVPQDTSIKEAIIKSKINNYFPKYDLLSLPIGVFGKRVFEPEQYKLQNGDRVEIYRPLNKTPNQKRLERAKNS